MSPPLDLVEALAELSLTIHALRTNDIEPPRDCRRRAAAAFIMAACGQLDSKGVLAAYRKPRFASSLHFLPMLKNPPQTPAELSDVRELRDALSAALAERDGYRQALESEKILRASDVRELRAALHGPSPHGAERDWR